MVRLCSQRSTLFWFAGSIVDITIINKDYSLTLYEKIIDGKMKHQHHNQQHTLQEQGSMLFFVV